MFDVIVLAYINILRVVLFDIKRPLLVFKK